MAPALPRSAGNRGGSYPLRRAEGAQAAGTGDDGEVIVDRAPVSTGRGAQVTDAGGIRFFVGRRSDPFFFDLNGALHDMQFTGDDFFADKNVSSIVLEVPNSALGPGEVRLWARTLAPTDGAGGGWMQMDRGARPAQSVFLPGDARDAYLAGEPADDARFVAAFAHSLEHLGGYTSEDATRVARTLLPDLLYYDPTRPASFPKNGRLLTDDVQDAFLTIITNGRVTGDKVGPHRDFLTEFPYLGPPHDT